MLYYVIEAVTKQTPVRLHSFSDYDHATAYANAYRSENPNSFWVGIVDQDEWYNCFV